MLLTKKRNEKYNEKDQNFVMKEPEKEISQLKLSGSINKEKVIRIIDTGAKYNYINKSLAQRLNLNVHKSKEICCVQVANGNVQKIENEYNVEFIFKKIPHKKYNLRLLEFENLPVDINIGLKWLWEQKVNIDLGQETITIDNRCVNILEHEGDVDDFNSLDQEIYDKIMLSVSRKTIEKQLDTLKIKSNELGLIKGYEHTIELKSNEPISLKPYPIR